MRYIITLPLVIFFSLVLNYSVQAQICPCGTDPETNDCCPPPDAGAPVPITGIEILVGAGALLGVKRLMANRKSNP